MDPRALSFVADHHYHHYTSPMQSQQGANIQGSQTILNANFNYFTPSEREREERKAYETAMDLFRVSETEAHDITRLFVDYYYPTFCRDPFGLANLYGEDSTLTLDGETSRGSERIIAKFYSLPYRQVKFNISSFHHQLDTHSGGIIIHVKGQLMVGDRPPALKFSQVFLLRRTSQGTWYIANDMFSFD